MRTMKKFAFVLLTLLTLFTCPSCNRSVSENTDPIEDFFMDDCELFMKWVQEHPDAPLSEIRDQAEISHVRMEVSPDENIRAYSWVSGGGSSPCWTTYTQYRDSKGNILFKPGLPVFGVHEDTTVSGIYGGDVINGKKHYFVNYYAKASSVDAYSFLSIVHMEGDSLIISSEFLKKGKSMESLDLNYNTADWYTTAGDDGWNWIYQYDFKRHRLYAMIADGEKHLTDRFEVYEHNGHMFNYIGMSGSPMLYPGLREYKKLVLVKRMEKHLVRIDQMPDNTYRMALWNYPTRAKMSEKPDYVFSKGYYLEESFTYRFLLNNETTYDYMDLLDPCLKLIFQGETLIKEFEHTKNSDGIAWMESHLESMNELLPGHIRTEQILLTDNHLIRIDMMSDGNYRYASWNKENMTYELAMPDLLLENGTKKYKDWADYYVFQNGSYTYHVPLDESEYMVITLPDGSQILETVLHKFHKAELKEMLERQNEE